MATFRDNFALGVDVSAYQDRVDWSVLKNGGVSFAFARASYGTKKDARFAAHVQGCFDAGIPCMAYHALDPGYYFAKLQTLNKLQEIDKWLPPEQDEQFRAFQDALLYKKIYALAVDFEIFSDWNGGTMPEMWLWEVVKQFCKRVRKQYPQYPLVLYTGAWFVWNYCKTIETMGGVPDTSLWVAFYPYDKTVVNTTWEELKKYYPPETMTINFPDGKRQTQNPPFLGWNTWTFWQFSGDKFKLPGVYSANGGISALDLNFFNGTKQKFYQWLGVQQSEGGTPTQPSEPPVVTPPTEPPSEPPANNQPADLSKALVAAAKAFLEAMGEK